MNIYKGLMFLEGFRFLPEHADDVAAPVVPPVAQPASSPAPRRAPAAASGWRGRLRGIAAVAGVTPVGTHRNHCG